MPVIRKTVGPFRSELAAKMYREGFFVAERPHNVALSATIWQDAAGWHVDTSRQPRP